MMFTPQTLPTVFDESVHLCFGKKWAFFPSDYPSHNVSVDRDLDMARNISMRNRDVSTAKSLH